MRAYRAVVGASDGNIIAAIITTHTPKNQPSAPRSVPGPASIPAIRSAVDHHATAAKASSRPTRPSRALTAANAAASWPRSEPAWTTVVDATALTLPTRNATLRRPRSLRTG